MIDKQNNDEITKLSKHYLSLISKQTKINVHYIFNKHILKAQKTSAKDAKQSYTEALKQYIKPNEYNIILDETGKQSTSEEFAQILTHGKINFFIGGAYGFDKEFLSKANTTLSLSRMTFTHSMARLFLYEQIYRGFCIQSGHPYHKV